MYIYIYDCELFYVPRMGYCGAPWPSLGNRGIVYPDTATATKTSPTSSADEIFSELNIL